MLSSLLSRLWRPALVVLIGALGYALYQIWPQLLFQIIQWQVGFQRELGQLLRGAAHAGGDTTLALVGASFAYGVFHAAGPGHGKLVISTYLATQPSKLRQALTMSVWAALLQALVAISLIGVASWLFGLSARQAQGASVWFERGSFLLVAGMGCLLAWRAGRQLRQLLHRARPTSPVPLRVHALQAMTRSTAQPLPIGVQGQRPASASRLPQCGCGHAHVPDQAALNQAEGWRSRLTLVLSMGLRPCSGALLILVLARVMNQFWLGVLATLAMAAGTALTVSLLGILSQRARQLAYRLLQQPGRHARQLEIAMQGLALAGGVILLAAGVLLMSAPTSLLMPR